MIIYFTELTREDLTILMFKFQESEIKLNMTTDKLNMYKRLLKLNQKLDTFDHLNLLHRMNQVHQMKQMHEMYEMDDADLSD